MQYKNVETIAVLGMPLEVPSDSEFIFLTKGEEAAFTSFVNCVLFIHTAAKLKKNVTKFPLIL